MSEETKKYTPKELKKKLSQKQKIFCHEYIIDWNASRAAREAGYSGKTAKEIGSQNLTKDYIVQYIDLIKNDIEKEAGISKLKQVKKLLEIADNEYAKDKDRISSRSEVNKMMGYNAPEKIDHTTGGDKMEPTIKFVK